MWYNNTLQTETRVCVCVCIVCVCVARLLCVSAKASGRSGAGARSCRDAVTSASVVQSPWRSPIFSRTFFRPVSLEVAHAVEVGITEVPFDATADWQPSVEDEIWSLATKSVAELRKMARGLAKNVHKMRKAELIDLLVAA